MISPETIEAVKKNAPILEVVGELVKIKRTGSNYSGLCPFHNERSPSFHVKPADNYFHCFGCGESGNVITFVMKTQGLSFPEAVESLANRFNIAIVYTDNRSKAAPDLTRDVYRLNALAYEFFTQQLNVKNSDLNSYLVKRQLSAELIKKFGVGFALNEWDALHKFFNSRSIPLELQLISGLIRKNTSNKIYDTFRNRLIFPVWADNKRISGFGGRIMPGSEDAAKYLNSPESPVYHKSKILYGWPQAISAIKDKKAVYVVEGYMDVIALHRVGVENVLATCGTALTPQHISRLADLTKKIILLFDGDSAGQGAAAKSFRQMADVNADVYALFIPAEMDPDDLAKAQGAQTAAYLENLKPLSLLECFLRQKFKDLKISSAREIGAVTKSKLAIEVMEIVNSHSAQMVRNEMIKQASFLLNCEAEDLSALSVKSVYKEDYQIEEPEIEIAAGKIKDIQALTPLERAILQAAIIRKEDLPGKVLLNTELCSILSQEVINFISGISEITSESGLDYSERKNRAQSLLKTYPASWSDLWKDVHKLPEDAKNQTEALYRDCLEEAARQRLLVNIQELDIKIRAGADDEVEKTRLMQDRLTLKRQLDKLQGQGRGAQLKSLV